MAGLQVDLGQGSGQTISAITPKVAGSSLSDAVQAAAPLAKSVLSGYAVAKTEDQFEYAKAGYLGAVASQEQEVAKIKQRLVDNTSQYLRSKSPELFKKVQNDQAEIGRIRRGESAGRIGAATAKAMIDNIVAKAASAYPWAKSEIKVLSKQFEEDGELNTVLSGVKFNKEMADKTYDEKRSAMADNGLSIDNPVHEAIFDAHRFEYGQAKMSLDLMKQQSERQTTEQGMSNVAGNFANKRIEKAVVGMLPSTVSATLSEVVKTQYTPDQKVAMWEQAEQNAVNEYLKDAAQAGVPQEDRNKTVSVIRDMFAPGKTEIESGDLLKYRERVLKTLETNRKIGIEENYGAYLTAKDTGQAAVYQEFGKAVADAYSMPTGENKRKVDALAAQYNIDLNNLEEAPKKIDEFFKTGYADGMVKMMGLVYSVNGNPLPPGTDKTSANAMMAAAAEPPEQVATLEAARNWQGTLDALAGKNYIASVIDGTTPEEVYKNQFLQQLNLATNKFKEDVKFGVKDGQLGFVSEDGSVVPYKDHPLFKAVNIAGNIPGVAAAVELASNVDRDLKLTLTTMDKLQYIVSQMPKRTEGWVGKDGIGRGQYQYEPTKWESFGSVFQKLAVETFGNPVEQTAYNLGVPASIATHIVRASDTLGIPPEIIKRQIGQESSFNQNAISPTGVKGLVQMTRKTASGLGLDPDKMRSNKHSDIPYQMEGYTKYMKYLLDMFNGDTTLAVLAYNSGEDAAKKYLYKGVKPRAEGVNYVKKILGVDL